MDLDISKWSAALDSVKNPMLYSALSNIIAFFCLLTIGLSSLPVEFRMWFCGITGAFIAISTFLVMYFSRTDPRFLTYGPREYLRESELSQELKAAKIPRQIK